MRLRNRLIAVLVLALLALLAGCKGGEDVGSVDQALVGTWRLTQVNAFGGTWAPAAIGWAYEVTLRGDGTYVVTELWEGRTDVWSGEWGTDGTTITLSDDMTGTYLLAGGILTVSTANYDGEGHPGTLTFAKVG
jgi:hypothetical protein